jgi:tol-pal system protein YbgF
MARVIVARQKQAATTMVAASIYLVIVTLSNLLHAQQAEVRDVRPAVPGMAVDIPGTIQPLTAPAPSVNEKLFSQLQILQQEVLELRGQVELQDHEIKKLKQQRLDDYLDLDRRIGEISQPTDRTNQTENTASSVRSVDPQSNSGVGVGIAPAIEPGEDEKERYNTAIDQVLKQRDYAAAQAGFNDYLTRYPQGYYTPNVYYWQGEIFLLQGRDGEATSAFNTLISQYPNHNKVPDAKYKLAKVYFNQGKKDEAKRLLESVVQSAVDASRLAQSFLDSHY